MADADFSPTFSAPYKPLTSITLPRNFAPGGMNDGDEPRTPDQTFAELPLPPPPHQTFRVRRPRLNMTNFQARNNALPTTLFASEIPIPSSVYARERESSLPDITYSIDSPLPSIEVPSSPLTVRPTLPHSLTDPSPVERLTLPICTDYRPTTPPAQTKSAVVSNSRIHAWDMERSSSVSSIRSDSSLSSCDTFNTRPTSFGGSVTSPEMDADDPFSPRKFNIIPDTPSRQNKRVRLSSGKEPRERINWTIEMDNHLFNIYQMYLGDPTVTPFKTVPGSLPPTGVCHRVARKAKTTWRRATMISRPIINKFQVRDVMEDLASIREKTPEPNDFLRVRGGLYRSSSGDGKGPWPSEKATRRRLKQLCKEKFTISAHYQRLRDSRSPSPFNDQFTRRPSGRITRSMSRQVSDGQTIMSGLQQELTSSPGLPSSTAYATRELGISLVASGATAPLAQLVVGDSPEVERQSQDEWFNTPINSSSDRMNTSPPSGLGIDTTHLAPASSIPRLASPFKPFSSSTWNGPTRSNRAHRREISQNQFDTVHATGSRLLSPFRLEPDVSNNANKRRAQHNLEDELSPNGSNIQQQQPPAQEIVFTGIGDISQRRIRLRNRGATLGAMSNTDRLSSLFAPPPPPPVQHSDLGPLQASGFDNLHTRPTTSHANTLAPPEADERQKRLGSPFELDPNKRSTRSRMTPRHIPSLSDPFVVYNPPSVSAGVMAQQTQQSIGERLAAFAMMHQQAMGIMSTPTEQEPPRDHSGR